MSSNSLWVQAERLRKYFPIWDGEASVLKFVELERHRWPYRFVFVKSRKTESVDFGSLGLSRECDARWGEFRDEAGNVIRVGINHDLQWADIRKFAYDMLACFPEYEGVYVHLPEVFGTTIYWRDGKDE